MTYTLCGKGYMMNQILSGHIDRSALVFGSSAQPRGVTW
jgi:hypothetical protein